MHTLGQHAGIEWLHALGRNAEIKRLYTLGRRSAPGWSGNSRVAPGVEVAVVVAVVLAMAREAAKVSSV